MSTELTENDDKRIAELLTGHRIVAAETGDFPLDARYSWQENASGRLTLDDGTQVYVIPNQGGCVCSAGDYDLEHLATVDNVITSVRVADEDPNPDDYGWVSSSAHAYRIYVVADAVEVNVLSVEGDDGNGYYGTGYELIVVAPQETA